MPDQTFRNEEDVPYYLRKQGWEAQYDGAGNLIGFVQPTALDDTRGARQQRNEGNQGIVPGSDYAFNFLPVDKWNGGNFDPANLEYRTGGTSVYQNNPEPFPGAGDLVKTFIAAVGAGAGGEALGLFGPGGFNGMMGINGATGAATTAAGTLTPEQIAAIYAAGDIPATEAALASTGWLGATDAATYALAGTPSVYGPTGLTTELASQAYGPTSALDGSSAASNVTGAGTGSTTGSAAAGSGLVNSIAKTLGIDPATLQTLVDVGKIVIPGVGAVASYLDADKKDGTKTGSPEISNQLVDRSKIAPYNNSGLANFMAQGGPQFTPTWTTGLTPPPAAGQRTNYVYDPRLTTGLIPRRT